MQANANLSDGTELRVARERRQGSAEQMPMLMHESALSAHLHGERGAVGVEAQKAHGFA